MEEQRPRIESIARALWYDGFSRLPQYCGQESQPGVNEVPEWQEWSDREPTADQRRIERRLHDFLAPGDRLLHVGVGGSELAAAFAPHVREVIGMTISPVEARRGGGLALDNYRVLLWNKYTYWGDMPRGVDAIVDNNPTTFACCLRHIVEMIAWYADSLTPAGALFTDRVGLSWVVSNGDEAWSFDPSELARLVAPFGLSMVRIDRNVYGVTRGPGIERLERLRRRAYLRSLRSALAHPLLVLRRVWTKIRE